MKRKYLVVLLLVLFTLTGCAISKKALNGDEIKNKVEDMGIKVTDIKSSFSGMDHVINAYKFGNSNYYIEYLEISDVEKAKIIFQNNKERIDSNRNGSYTNMSTSGNNYETYELVSDGYYMYISRVDNTLIYADDKVEYEKEVKKLIEDLGY